MCPRPTPNRQMKTTGPAIRIKASESEKQKSSGMSSTAARQHRIEELADDILVNDTLIDNRLSDVHTTCYMRFPSREEQKIVRLEKLWSKRLCVSVWFWTSSIFRLFRILFSLAFRKAPRLPNTEYGPFLLPSHPETVWIRWATALIAQANWMAELGAVVMPTGPRSRC